MMYALVAFFLIAIKVQGQEERCSLTPELKKLYQEFHDEWFKRRGRGYVTVTFNDDMYPLAKDVLNEPGKYATNNEVYRTTRGSRVLAKRGMSIVQKVDKVLRGKFILQLVKLGFAHPRKFACAGKFTEFDENHQNLTIACIYARVLNHN
ncbi:hypothetical protein Q1695_004490 [Nippostrongylus brasiliensis]|nr:hypothetical protein Q1695_004490 [Nippostrongylus brasiliensis]